MPFAGRPENDKFNKFTNYAKGNRHTTGYYCCAKTIIGKNQGNKFMSTESKQQIIERRKEIERELVDMLKETESDFSLQHVKDAIFHEEDSDDMMKVVAMFDRGGGASELENILELVSDAWNYFPHQALNGLSPAEKLLKHK
ncbi:MAG: hypothetical protein A3J93_05640 [Candidatus Magasanikbacteria bacterium RIFOXYC2_FULL_42_28]|uniref:Uncharacterized protein n=1 Tax=Candidatus Magasanikbacteria bacterium RIFOXYC2_FULL_42_28 TaxID=1798704 RepID=A0A1F6NWT7_9BACT|nr:MAG: hypothetical protein A3J93_05640 [Candidatus Magasanikbacteria bacterium RIFOXYC2_FULL_42_28]